MIFVALGVALLFFAVVVFVMTPPYSDARLNIGIPLGVCGGAVLFASLLMLGTRHADVPSSIAKHAYLTQAAKALEDGDPIGEDVYGEIVKFNVWLAECKAWNRQPWDDFFPDSVCALPHIQLPRRK